MFKIGKLQIIKKANNRVIYSLYPPLDLVSQLGWDKGQELEFEIMDNKLLVRAI